MDPYERTAQEMKRQAEGPKRFFKSAAAIGSAIGGVAFAPMLARAAPFLSQYIPEDLAIKGLNKVSPRFGSFIKDAFDKGFDFNEVKDFMGEQVKQSQAATAKQDKNIIEQESPELHSFLDQEIRKGRKPIEAGALAQTDKRFKEVIRKLMKAHKTPWSSIIESIYGVGDMAQPSQQQAQPQQQQETGQGLDPGVAQILQQGSELLKRFRGQM